MEDSPQRLPKEKKKQTKTKKDLLQLILPTLSHNLINWKIFVELILKTFKSLKGNKFLFLNILFSTNTSNILEESEQLKIISIEMVPYTGICFLFP